MTFRNKMFGAAACVALGLCGSAVRADIKGSVKLDGKPPEMPEINMKAVAECAKQHRDPVFEETIVAGDKGELANVIVSIKTDDPSSLGGEPIKTPAVLDQKGCRYVPHVLAMMVGQPMKVKNDDPFQHNVHSQSSINPPFNFGQPNKDDGKDVESPKASETYKVKCDVHPWMGAWIAVFDHPFFAVSGEDGKFDIKGKVPEGEYTVVAWHEKLGSQEAKVKVDANGEGTIDFTFKAEGAAGPSENPGQAKLASAKGEGASKDASCCEAEKPAGATKTASTK